MSYKQYFYIYPCPFVQSIYYITFLHQPTFFSKKYNKIYPFSHLNRKNAHIHGTRHEHKRFILSQYVILTL